MNTFDLDECFFGREAILNLLAKRVLNLKEGYRQNVALIGPRYIGKTAIIHKFLANLEDEDILAVHLDLNCKDFRHFSLKFTGSLLYQFARYKKIHPCDSLSVLKEALKGFIPKTVEEVTRIQSLTDHGKNEEAYNSLLALPEKLTVESGKFCVLVFDEFHRLEEFPLRDVFQKLGQTIMTQRRCLYVVASSYPKTAETILAEKLSLLFGNFEMLNIGPFDLKTGQDFVSAQLKDARISDSLRNFLVDFTGGHPLYLKLISEELARLSVIHKQEEIFAPLLIQAIENTMFNLWGVVGRHFSMILNDLIWGRASEETSPILIALADGYSKVRDLAAHLKIKQEVLKQKLSRLIDEDTIGKNGNFYFIQDKLFKYWVKFIYTPRLRSVDYSLGKQRSEFRRQMEAMIENFRSVSQKGVSSRIVELLHCFDNEAITHNGRQYKLPYFEQIVPASLRNRETGECVDCIKAQSIEGNWFIVIAKETVREPAVNLLLEESKKLDEKPRRCVIVALSDLDENARVKALQEKVWIWNELELNTLLDLFGKPYIV